MIVDQASSLRALVKEAGLSSRVIAVTSGKGGVGKTSCAVNLALACSRLGQRVTLVDFDLGLANVDVIMDIRPLHNLSHVVMGKMRVRDVAVSAEGIRVIPGASGLRELANLAPPARDELIRSLQTLEEDTDLVIIDTGAGISGNVVRVAASADEVLVICTPEPTSIMDAYATIKMITREPAHGRLRVVVNMAAERKEAERVSNTMADVSRRFLSIDVDRVGFIPWDEHVPKAVKERRPFGLLYPHCAASVAVRGLARVIVNGRAPERRQGGGFFARLVNALAGTSKRA
ncbi:MAG TPA: MinD/ParA family protein [Planctomycetota bacterium]|nr:MinD/ParA family protein [Planctomycetota bacterium]